MKRFYQTEWQGIQFDSFAKLSTDQLADAAFYNAFYRELFKRYGASVIRSGMGLAKDLLMQLGLYRPGQFWGWIRTRSDYHKLMEKARFNSIEDGFITPAEKQNYFIIGR